MSLFTRNASEQTTQETVAYWLLLALIVIVPVFVYVTANISPIITKVGLGGVLVLAGLVMYALGAIRVQTVTFPRSLLLASVWMLPIAYALSTLFAGEYTISAFGARLSMDTLAFMFTGAAAMSLAAVMLQTQKRVLGAYMAFVAAGVVVALAELILFFARDFVASTGAIFPSLSVLGTLNDLAVFFGLIAFLTLLSLLMLPLTQIVRGVLWVVLLGALYFLAVVNLSVIWWILGVFALGVFVYSVTNGFGKAVGTVTLSSAAIVTLVACAYFLLAPDQFTGAPAQWARVGELDVRPSWQTTISIGRTALGDQAFFGVGPGGFERAWSLHMPASLNQTDFWQASFAFGIGFIPTSIISTGIIGTLAWLLFIAMFIMQGVRYLVLRKGDGGGELLQYLRVTSFLAASYVWVVAFIQVPSAAILLYAFVLTGIFVATCSLGADAAKPVRIVFGDNSRVGFVATLALTITILGSISGMYGFVSRVLAESSYQQAVRTLETTGDIDVAAPLAHSAVALNPVDAYYRLLSTIDLVQLQRTLTEGKPPEEMREKVTALLASAIQNATKATERDPQNHQNWTNLGALYQSIIPLADAQAAESGLAAFDKALALRPNAAYVYQAKAVLERARGSTEAARENVQKAIDLRNNYTEAIFLLAQLQLEANDVTNAVRSVEAITLLEPGNPVAYFQLGLLKYGTDDFEGARQALIRAIELSPDYANARYFLGLTHWRLGDTAAALAEFEKVSVTNPENNEVKAIISNLRSGKAPFESDSAASDIQTLNTLPVGEGVQGGVIEASTPPTIENPTLSP